MDKKLVLAVAGSGKTYHIVEHLNEQERFLLITYTINGTQNLRNEILDKFGYIPQNIKIKTFFNFLYSFCYKPFLADIMNEKGITWNYPQNFYDKSFITKGKYLYHNRISKLLIDKKVILDVIQRVEEFYDFILIDEIQDFAGNDFDFLMEISKLNIKMLFVGDFFQHTFDTSRDGMLNKNLHIDLNKFVKRFTNEGFELNSDRLIKSRRCSKSTCDFINKRLQISIESYSNNITECKLITDSNEANEIFNNNSIVKLFLKEHYKYNCCSENWGACKGLSYENVCVVLNKDTFNLFKSDGVLNFKSQSTKNKFYVACSRTRNNLYFVENIFNK